MKRFLAVVLAVVLCLWLFSAPMIADPGDEATTTTTTTSDTTWVNPDYPPPPPGYVGIWPPPDLTGTLDGGSTTTGDGGDEGSWVEPGQ